MTNDNPDDDGRRIALTAKPPERRDLAREIVAALKQAGFFCDVYPGEEATTDNAAASGADPASPR